MHRLVVWLVVGLLAAGCTTATPEDESTTSSTIPPAASVMGVAAGSWPSCLNPLLCTGDPARQLVYQHVLPRLLEIDHRGRYVPSPVLAGPPMTEVDEVTGEQHITYRIDPDARWHDGRPITSTDVRGTWMARVNTPGAASGLDRAVVDVDDRDPLVARVTLAAPHANWRELFGGYRGWLLQADAFGDDTDLTGAFTDDLPFGAGPFELASFEDGQIVLAARADHWAPGRSAGVDRVHITRVEPDGTLPTGIDVVLPGVDTGEVPDDLDARSTPTAEVVGLFFDQRTPALADPAVRHAIDLVVDRRNLVEVVVETGDDAPALVSCLGWLSLDPSCEETLSEAEEDAEAAEALLSQAGWVRDEAGDRAGPFGPFAIPITFDPELPRALAVADAVRFRLRTLGATVTEERGVPESEWRQRGREASTGIGVFAVELGTPARVVDLYACPDGSPNPMAWCPPELQARLAELAGTIAQDDRRPIASAIGALAADAFAWLPLHQRTETWLAAGDRVDVPAQQPLGGGPLGALHAFTRAR